MQGEVQVPVATEHVATIQGDQEKAWLLRRCAVDFEEFLKQWRFLDQETGRQRSLGESLWSGQLKYARAMKEHDRVYILKARKLGATTLGIAWDGWVARFGMTNARVHLFSRRDDAAQELLQSVKYGLQNLPEWMQLPVTRGTTHELVLNAGSDDRRLVKCYPSDTDTAVEASCNHSHLDEWARMGNPQRVWQAIEPSVAGTCHIITTGLGPGNYSATFWNSTMSGDTEFHPFFLAATERPDRDEKWVEAKRRSMSERDSRHEYPMTPEDSLFAGADLPLAGEALDLCGAVGVGRRDAIPGHEYVTAWDIGRHADAAVGIVLDVTDVPYQVVDYVRIRGYTYPQIQQEVEDLHRRYPGLTHVEDNNAGEAVRENLELPAHEVRGFKTTPASKPRIIKRLEVAIANGDLAWLVTEYPQLHHELATYQIPDSSVVQDSVMAISIAFDRAVSGNTAGGEASVILV